MYDLTILSIFRQSEKYVNRCVQQVTEAFDLNGGKCHAVWLEGDSTDNTYKILQQAKEKLEQTGNVDVTLIKFDNGGPYWGSIVDSDRWLQIATCWNNCLAGLKPSKITICVESDLIYNPRITTLLRRAAECGAKTHGGLGMLVYQGACAFEYWTGLQAPVQSMWQAVTE
jgi:hypothetical protein